MQKSCEMFYLAGYISGCFLLVTVLPWIISSLHRSSAFKPTPRTTQERPLTKSRTVITFSIVLPFMALSYVVLTYAPMRLAQNQGQQGHLLYIFSSLLIPVLCFLAGFTYFRKSVGT